MIPTRLSFLARGCCLILLVACASKLPPQNTSAFAPVVGASPFQGINEVSQVKVEEGQEGVQIIIEATAPLSPNIFKLSDPDRIIVDLTETKLGSSISPSLEVGKGGINQITANQFDDAKSSLSRVVIGLNQPLEYKAESSGNNLTLIVAKTGISDIAAQAGLPAIPEIAPVPDLPTTESPPLLTEPTSPTSPDVTSTPIPDQGEPLPFIAPPAISEETTASQLVDIQYSASETGTVVKLVGDAPIKTFEDFVLKKPDRVVVDLKGMKNAYAGGKTITLGTAEVSKVRIGKSKDNLRIVLDASEKGVPAYTVTREENNLVINLASAPKEQQETTNVESPVSEQVTPEATTPDATTIEPTPDLFPVVEPVPPPKPTKLKPVTITGLGFKQIRDQNKSRLIVGLSDANVEYTSREDGPNRVVVSISNSRIEKPILKREFNTSEFQTAILSVTPKVLKKSKTTEFVVELEQQVPYTLTQEGNDLFLDVEIPAQILRKQTPTVARAQSISPLPPEEEAVQQTLETGEPSPQTTLGGESSATVKEKLLLSEEITPTLNSGSQEKKGKKPLKNYAYVHEEFMSDSLGSEEPLSQMGQILAGQFDGKRFVGRKISLDFKDADIRSIFRLIADISKFNMIISDDVDGRVTIRLDEVPWDQAFAIILQTRGLWFEKYGNIVRIAPAEKLRKEKELAAAAQRAAKAAKPLDVLFKPVSFAQAATLFKQVGSVLSERGSVDIDSRTNTLIIKDIRENLDKAKRMVDILDTQTPQVSIESRIVEATTTFTRSFGITWSGNARFTAATGNPTGLFFPNSVNVPFAMNFPVEAGFINTTATLNLGSINNILDLDLALALGEQEGHSKLISAPKVTVLDNKSATITAGSKIPFLTQTANAGSNVRFENAATSLSVTPHVTNDGSILMTINATRNQPNFAQLVQGNPLIDQRSANTEVLVKSGNTTVVGGIYATQHGRSVSRFPFLSSIPIIGALFRNYDKQLRRTELLIFVTPRIVGDEREAVRDIRE